MKKVCVGAQLVAIALGGCSISPMQYSGYDCAQIAAQLRHLYTRASDLASLGDTGAPEAQYARLREEFDALREAAAAKQCQGPTPPLQQATSDSATHGGTGPRIAPPEAPPEY